MIILNVLQGFILFLLQKIYMNLENEKAKKQSLVKIISHETIDMVDLDVSNLSHLLFEDCTIKLWFCFSVTYKSNFTYIFFS